MELSLSTTPLSLSRPFSPSSFSPLSSSHSSFFTNNATSLLLRQQGKAAARSAVALSRPRNERSKRGMKCYALFGLGVPELVVIAGVAALVFGPKKLPEVGKSIGKTVKSFQQAAKEFESELKKAPDSGTDVPAEQPTAVSEEKKEEETAPSSKETV